MRPAATSIEAALEAASERQPARGYRVGEVAKVLVVFAAVLVFFDSEGLLIWAERLSAGHAQRVWLGALRPVHRALDWAGFTAPRQQLTALGSAVASRLGVHEDPILQQGWAHAPPPEEVVVAPAEPARIEEEARPSAPVAPAAPTVLLLGDSLIAGSLGTALTAAFSRDHQVARSFQVATGLTRPEVFDWMKVLPALLEREAPALIICSLGTNDGVDMWDEGRLLGYGEAAWRAAYKRRVQRMMELLSGRGARVLWLGLPPMRAQGLSTRAKALNRIYEETAARVRGVDFIDVTSLVAGPEGGYSTFVRGASGAPVRARLDDGVHYAPGGARAIAVWAVDWAREREAKRR